MRFHPGGHRNLKRCDARIIGLFSVLMNMADGESFIIEHFNQSETARRFGVHPNTIRNWLDHFERWGFIKRECRYGGRGIVIEVSWLERGKQLEEAHRRYLGHKKEAIQKRQQNKEKWLTLQQDEKHSLHPTGDSKNRAMRDARLILTDRIKERLIATHAVRAFGMWIKQHNPTRERIRVILQRLRSVKRLPVPRWCKEVQDVYRWIRGLITNLLADRNWIERFEAKLEKKQLRKVLKRIDEAAKRGEICPICKRKHSVVETERGRNRNGDLNCAGWAWNRLQNMLEVCHAPPKPLMFDTVSPKRNHPTSKLDVPDDGVEFDESLIEQQRALVQAALAADGWRGITNSSLL